VRILIPNQQVVSVSQQDDHLTIVVEDGAKLSFQDTRVQDVPQQQVAAEAPKAEQEHRVLLQTQQESSTSKVEVKPSIWGEQLRAFRTARSLSQEDIGKVLQYSQTFISAIETGRAIPQGTVLRKLEELFRA
jgi:ribosome-binding protein aMBF1 (putative translation factor)